MNLFKAGHTLHLKLTQFLMIPIVVLKRACSCKVKRTVVFGVLRNVTVG